MYMYITLEHLFTVVKHIQIACLLFALGD